MAEQMSRERALRLAYADKKDIEAGLKSLANAMDRLACVSSIQVRRGLAAAIIDAADSIIAEYNALCDDGGVLGELTIDRSILVDVCKLYHGGKYE